MKRKNIALLLMCGLIMVGVSGCTASETRRHEFGNTSGNIYNNGTVLTDGDWIYFTNHDDNEQLYKKKLDGGEEKQLAMGHFAYNLNLIGSDIYCISGSPGYIYRVDTEGRWDNRLVDKKTDHLMVTNESMFYQLAEDDDWGKLYKADLDGKNEVLLASRVLDFAIDDAWIYYTDLNDHCYLYKMDWNGKNKVLLNDEYTSFINIDDTFVYFTENFEKSHLYRMRLDGSDKKLLSDDKCWDVNLHNGYIYYRNQTREGKIYRMKSDGSENQVLIDQKNCVDINVTDNFLIYRKLSWSDGGYFRADLDGSNIQKWADD